MNTEQVYTLGKIAYFSNGASSRAYEMLLTVERESWERTAQAIATEVLKRLPEWGLIPYKDAKEGDQYYSSGLGEWRNFVGDLPLHSSTPVRRRIVPEQQPQLGSQDDVRPHQGASPDQGSDIVPIYSDGTPVAMVTPPVFATTPALPAPVCIKCAVLMKRSKAIPEAVVPMGEGQYSVGAHVGHAPLVDVWKCPECGHSFRAELAVNQMFHEEAERESERQKKLREGKTLMELVMPPLQPYPHGMGDTIATAPPTAPRAEWKPKFAVGDQVQIRTPHHPWDFCMKKIGKVLKDRQRYVFADDSRETSWPESALKPYTLASEPAPWGLPEPPSGHEWHMPDTVTAEELGDKHRLCVKGEKISPGAQYFERGAGSWSSTAKSFGDPLGSTETYRVPLSTPLPAPSTPETKGVIMVTKDELDFMRQERDAALARTSEAEKDLHAVKEELKHASDLEQNERAIRVAFESELKCLESTLKEARASVPVWVPRQTRMPTVEDAMEVTDGRGRPCMAVRWCFNSWGGPRCAVGPWNEPIKESTHWQKLSPLPPLPVETEEGDGFEEWWEEMNLDDKETAQIVWQAALRSKKPPLGSP